MAEKTKFQQGGRPSKYHRDYCEMLKKHMGTEGLSYEAFAGSIGVCIETLYQWEKKYPAFLEAKREAFSLNRVFWERIGTAGMAGKIPGFNATVWIFNMKNRHGWRDRIETEHKGQIDSNINLNAQIVNLIEQLEAGSDEDDDSV